MINVISKELQYTINLLENTVDEINTILLNEGLYPDVIERLTLERTIALGAIEQIKNM